MDSDNEWKRDVFPTSAGEAALPLHNNFWQCRRGKKR
jgi:hypothetical protein